MQQYNKKGILFGREKECALFLYSRKVLLAGETSVLDKYGESQIFLKFAFDRKSQTRFFILLKKRPLKNIKKC